MLIKSENWRQVRPRLSECKDGQRIWIEKLSLVYTHTYVHTHRPAFPNRENECVFAATALCCLLSWQTCRAGFCLSYPLPAGLTGSQSHLLHIYQVTLWGAWPERQPFHSFNCTSETTMLPFLNWSREAGCRRRCVNLNKQKSSNKTWQQCLATGRVRPLKPEYTYFY